VLETRIAAEYGVKAGFEAAPYETARWIDGDPAEIKRFIEATRGSVAEDRDGAPVFLARNAWELGYTEKHWPELRFTTTRERA